MTKEDKQKLEDQMSALSLDKWQRQTYSAGSNFGYELAISKLKELLLDHELMYDKCKDSLLKHQADRIFNTINKTK